MINPISKFLFLLTFSSCFSEPVNVDVPYSSGGIIVRRYQFNTKNFSNGLRVDFPYKMTGTAESKERMIGIAFDGFENAGYKYVQSADYGSVFSMNPNDYQDSMYISTDTSWINATIFPDSLVPLDNIIDTDESTGEGTVRKGRYFLVTHSTINFPAHTEETPIDNHNIIIYVSTVKNKMKLRISRMFMNSYPQPPTYDDILDSMEISWSVDSLGNGRFMTPVSTNKIIAFHNRHAVLNQDGINNSHSSLFDISGKRLPGYNSMVNSLIIFKQDSKYGTILIR
ncbi:MAG: hypothetical protein GX089_13430 [Fibrobacter sp.]|jgi:hypothetical protein|nr:hypothetical protein [Fibrobacter sp.]